MSTPPEASFTSQDAKRVRMSLVSMLPVMDGFSLALYNRLFDVAPGVRQMFSTNMDIQREKLVATLTWVASNAPKLASDSSEPEESVLDIKRRIRDLGRRHRELGVEPAHYDVLKVVMMDVLRNLLGEKLDEPTEAAWDRFYDIIAAEMIEGTPG